MHAKNIGLIHFEDETSTLTPAYDMVPLCHQNTDGRMALAISGEYRHASLTSEMIIKEVAGWGLNDAVIIVKDVLEEAHEKIYGLTPAEQAYPYVKDDIIRFIEHLLTNKPTGKSPQSN
jgi:serine/threonine-protein kinase HipA